MCLRAARRLKTMPDMFMLMPFRLIMREDAAKPPAICQTILLIRYYLMPMIFMRDLFRRPYEERHAYFN